MPHDVDAGRAVEPGRCEESMQISGSGVEVVSALGLIAVARAARIERVDLTAGLDEQRDDLSPSDPTLWPTGDQNDGLARTRGHVMKPHSVHADDVVPDIPKWGIDRLRQCGTCGRHHKEGHQSQGFCVHKYLRDGSDARTNDKISRACG